MRQDQADRSCTPIANSLDGTHFGGRLLTQGLLVAPQGASRQAPAEMNHRVLFACQTGFMHVPRKSVRYCDASMIP